MNARWPLALAPALWLAACSTPASDMSTSTAVRPPIAAKESHTLTTHGHTRIDEYFWMRLSEEQRSAAKPDAHTQRVVAHLEAENSYTDSLMAPVRGLREKLFKEMKARVKEDDLSVPYRENGYWYNFRYEKGKEYAIHMRRADRDAAPETDILNENILAEGHEFFDLGDFEIAPGNNICAYSVDTVGRRLYSIHFRDLVTGNDLPDVVPNTSGGGAWADDRTFFYAVKDSTLRDHKILRHVLGTDPSTDVEVFHEADPAYSCDVGRSRSDRFVMIATGSTMSTEELLLPVDRPMGAFTVFQPREEEHEYSAQHVPGKFYILTNWNAQNFRLMECPEDKTGKEHWKEVIAHRDEVLLEDVDLFRDHMVISERREGLVHLRVRKFSTGAEHEIAFHDPAYVAYGGTNAEWKSDKFRYGYTSLTTPSSVLEHDLDQRTDTLLKQQEVMGDFDASRYASERIWAVAKDGARVPISLVYRKGTKLDGTSPLLLAGYGSYGISSEPTFTSARLSLLDRGFVHAIAHIRGGEEMGRAWYEMGRMEHKMNTFTDFIACAEHLVTKKYADPARLFAWGGSAGGLLMGAVANLRPDLWKGLVAEVPFVDVVTTMLDESIPLTTGEFDEWGDPKEKDAYDRMLSYSPYDNVKDAAYPAMLVTTGFHDSQVQYWEPAKWVARLRDHHQGDAPILLHTNLDAGHGGASGRFERLKEVALNYAFLLWQAGVKE
ncbi:MAG: S9 family peptidase [Flavobacteriales bacterium]|nr:S9 family peptidase [Flavobacteriales bacterium]